MYFSSDKKIMEFPALLELHLLFSQFHYSPFEAVASSKCTPKVLNIPTDCFKIAKWSRYDFAPHDLRLLLLKVHSPRYSMHYLRWT